MQGKLVRYWLHTSGRAPIFEPFVLWTGGLRRHGHSGEGVGDNPDEGASMSMCQLPAINWLDGKCIGTLFVAGRESLFCTDVFMKLYTMHVVVSSGGCACGLILGEIS